MQLLKSYINDDKVKENRTDKSYKCSWSLCFKKKTHCVFVLWQRVVRKNKKHSVSCIRASGALIDGKFCSAEIGYWWATLQKSEAAANFSCLTHCNSCQKTALSWLLSSWKISGLTSVKTECQLSCIVEARKGRAGQRGGEEAEMNRKKGWGRETLAHVSQTIQWCNWIPRMNGNKRKLDSFDWCVIVLISIELNTEVSQVSIPFMFWIENADY